MSVGQIRQSLRLVFNVHVTSLFLDRENRVVARRSGSDVDCSGYVFTNRPFFLGESLTVRIHALSEGSKGVLGFGMTSCDPDPLIVQGLPEDCYLLYDRPEYWVIENTRFADVSPGDELDFHFVESTDGGGEIKFTKNDGKPVSLMFLDKTVPLWGFFELGNVREMKILESSSSYHLPSTIGNVQGTNTTSNCSLTSDTSRSNNSPTIPRSQNRNNASPQTIQVYPPPTQHERKTEGVAPSRPIPPPIPQRPALTKKSIGKPSQFAPTPLVPTNGGQVNYVAERLALKKVATDRTVGNQPKREAPPPPVVSQKPGLRGAQKTSSDNECAVCFEKDVDCVLYTCGHMCLCYACAVDLKNSSNALCPICRKAITDVIRTFKS